MLEYKKPISIHDTHYDLIKDHHNGWNEEAFQKRYSEILAKYDYIVGDWGYEQLRLRGFYDDHNPKATFDTKISTLVDYVVEYCNFGCAYFVLKKLTSKENKKA
ncbi:hypothetical protein GCM10011391_29170 [Pullulanibacillus camelliae]|uniref:DUF1027 domain-containing protein n=1 Tax=Pullulanibacillus camelliae TaxID=1707096 RepID=A0A8J3DXR1_9BACL|nr:YutD family protein [Pullulanibacillus camelliae]GGE48518.1 hypothetical protein GCM10011391_29170 [Pullulanibacillus camelliae]